MEADSAHDKCGAKWTKELAKQLLAAWQWTFVVGTADFCPPSPSMLKIGQFLDEAADVGDMQPGCWPTHEPCSALGKCWREEGGALMGCASPCKCCHWWTFLC